MGTRIFSGYTNTACTSTIYRAVPTAMLVVYCLRGVDLLGPTHGLPELLAGAAVVGLHLWKKNTLQTTIAVILASGGAGAAVTTKNARPQPWPPRGGQEVLGTRIFLVTQTPPAPAPYTGRCPRQCSSSTACAAWICSAPPTASGAAWWAAVVGLHLWKKNTPKDSRGHCPGGSAGAGGVCVTRKNARPQNLLAPSARGPRGFGDAHFFWLHKHRLHQHHIQGGAHGNARRLLPARRGSARPHPRPAGAACRGRRGGATPVEEEHAAQRPGTALCRWCGGVCKIIPKRAP